MTSEATTDFEAWLAEAHAATGDFTALIVLLRIGDTQVSPICSTYVNVIGPDVSWGDMTTMLAGAGQSWDGVAFFPEAENILRHRLEGPVTEVQAPSGLAAPVA